MARSRPAPAARLPATPRDPGADGDNWAITFADTGPETNTGGRIKRLQPYIDGDVFFATYGDGVADLDLGRLLAFHRAHGRIATVTAVQPSLAFGVLNVNAEGHVTRFSEKPPLDAWINGGSSYLTAGCSTTWRTTACWSSSRWSAWVAGGELMAYKHDGFWACMDTYKDTERLNELWRRKARRRRWR